MKIQDHPMYDLTLEQLLKERDKILAFNAKIAKPDYPFKGTIKPRYPRYLDELIKEKRA